MSDFEDFDVDRNRRRTRRGRVFPSIEDVLNFGQRRAGEGSAFDDLRAGRLSDDPEEAARAARRARRGLLLANTFLFVALFAAWVSFSPLTETGRNHPEYLTAYIVGLTVAILILGTIHVAISAGGDA